MLETISVVLGVFGLFGFFRRFGLFLGIGLVAIWLYKVKNTVALFYDKNKIRATLFFGVPGILSLILWAVFFFGGRATYGGGDDYDPADYIQEDYVPTLAYLHIVNKSVKPGRLKYGDTEEMIPAGDWKEINVKSKNEQDTLRGWLGDSLVMDTVIRRGSYIGNLSDDITAIAEEIVYSTLSTASTDDLEYIMLSEPGIRQFSPSLVYDTYDFDETAPSTISMSQYTTTVKKWDLRLATSDELMEMLLEALKEQGSSLDLAGEEEGDEGE